MNINTLNSNIRLENDWKEVGRNNYPHWHHTRTYIGYDFSNAEYLIEQYQKYIDWSLLFLCGFKTLPKTIIDKYSNRVNWINLSSYYYAGVSNKFKRLSPNFIRKFQDRLNWDRLSEYHNFTTKQFIEFKDKINWNVIYYRGVKLNKTVMQNCITYFQRNDMVDMFENCMNEIINRKFKIPESIIRYKV